MAWSARARVSLVFNPGKSGNSASFAYISKALKPLLLYSDHFIVIKLVANCFDQVTHASPCYIVNLHAVQMASSRCIINISSY